jgi:hypothetical protein
MAKKAMFFSLAVLLVFGLVSMASAAQNVANTSQKGSLLIFPKILAESGPNGEIDTYITIGNDYFQEVWVKCYWVDWDQNIEDFMFRLTPNQPVYFSARDGLGGVITVPPFIGGKGELKCWAVNAAGDQQISWNHLYGYAAFESFPYDYWTVYNAWSFTARGVPLGNAVGTGGELKLTGNTGGYDACPQYLLTNFYPMEETALWNNDLTLAPCKEDLRQDRTPTCTKAKFDIWNENETKYTGAYQCLKCWWEGYLNEIGTDASGFGGEKFTLNVLHTSIARFRVQSANNAACKAYTKGCESVAGVLTPFVGLMMEADQYAETPTVVPFAAFEPFTAGADGSGFVLWDAAGGTPEAPAK